MMTTNAIGTGTTGFGLDYETARARLILAQTKDSALFGGVSVNVNMVDIGAVHMGGNVHVIGVVDEIR